MCKANQCIDVIPTHPGTLHHVCVVTAGWKTKSGGRFKMYAEKVAQEVGLETFLMNHVGGGLPAASGTAFIKAGL